MICVCDVSHWTDRTLLILFDHKQVTFSLESLSVVYRLRCGCRKTSCKKKHGWTLQVNWSSSVCNSIFISFVPKKNVRLSVLFCCLFLRHSFGSFAAQCTSMYVFVQHENHAPFTFYCKPIGHTSNVRCEWGEKGIVYVYVCAQRFGSIPITIVFTRHDLCLFSMRVHSLSFANEHTRKPICFVVSFHCSFQFRFREQNRKLNWEGRCKGKIRKKRWAICSCGISFVSFCIVIAIECVCVKLLSSLLYVKYTFSFFPASWLRPINITIAQ